MKPVILAVPVAAGALLMGCAPNNELPEGVPAATYAAGTEVRGADGQVRATVRALQIADGVRVEVQARGMAPGSYGAHVHQAGQCDAPTFQTAGPHWNPTMRQHGMQNPQGQHRGDLPNLTVGADGTARIVYTIQGATISGGETPMLDGDGASFMIHARADDYRTDPSGNSGDRIACGVFGLETP